MINSSQTRKRENFDMANLNKGSDDSNKNWNSVQSSEKFLNVS